MAETPIEQRDPGAPIAPGQIDPDLVKLARSRTKVGLITAAGLVALSVVFLVRLGADRRFAGASATPAAATIADILAGKLETDQLVTLTADPVVSQAIRASRAEGTTGVRVAPIRRTGERLWLVISGDGWQPPAAGPYIGRLRRFDDLAFASATRAYAAAHSSPVFATAAAVRAGLAAGTVATVDGDPASPAPADQVALDVVDPGAATIAASFNDRLPDTAAWTTALTAAGLAPTATAAPNTGLGQVRFTVAASVTATTAQLDAAHLLDARVEPITHHYQTTWADLHKSPPTALDLGSGHLVPDASIELVGFSLSRGIPTDAYAIVTGEVPDDYWYVMWITVGLVIIALVFAWALIRAIRRDLIPPRAA